MESNPPPRGAYNSTLRAANYREEARRLREDAVNAIDDDARNQMLNIAAQYEHLALTVEMHARLYPSSSD
jgi:hypothetical protein